MVKVQFIKDFATKEKGETGEYAGQLASRLINKKVAKLYVSRGSKKKNVTD